MEGGHGLPLDWRGVALGGRGISDPAAGGIGDAAAAGDPPVCLAESWLSSREITAAEPGEGTA